MTIAADRFTDSEGLERECREWVLRLTSGAATSADAEAFVAWKNQSPSHAAAFKKTVLLRHALREAGHDVLMRQSSGPLATDHTVKAPVARLADFRLSRRAILGGAIAASAAGLMIVEPPLGLMSSFAAMAADYRTGVGEQKALELGPRVHMLLNTQSALSITARQAGVDLITGEANFRVSIPSGGYFVVKAGHTDIRAASAEFNVLRNPEGGGCVTCINGQLSITRNGDAVRLRTGQRLTYEGNKQGRIELFDQSDATAWIAGRLVFHDMTLSEIASQINRYRPGHVLVANDTVARMKFNGEFHIDRLDAALVSMQRIGVHVTHLPGGIAVLS